MKNPVIIIIFVFIIILGGGAFFLSQQGSRSSDSMMQNPSTGSGQDVTGEQESMEKGDAMTEGKYISYKSGVLDETTEKKRVLFFFANWCPTCIPADADFTKNVNKLSEDVVVIRVNYNDTETDQEEKDLARKYGITYQHTYVQIDSDGNEVTKWNGGATEEMLANIQ